MGSIFEKRVHISPEEYPQFAQYKDAIRKSYWTHDEYNLSSSIQDYHVNLTVEDREVVKKALLGIAQIEVNVKRFWGSLYEYLPKSEIDDVGGTFADSEVRHKDAYKFLLDTLGLEDEFKGIYNIPAIIDRVNYLSKISDVLKESQEDKKKIIFAVIIFSLFIEHVSLFGQFYTIRSFNKRRNQLTGLSNIVEATSKEEEIHGKFGIELLKVFKKEHPELFTPQFYDEVIDLVTKAALAERKVLDWIFEKGDLEHITKKEVESFIFHRFNQSLKEIGIDYELPVEEDVSKFAWFEEEMLATKEGDFFNKRSIDYNKQKQITEDDLF